MTPDQIAALTQIGVAGLLAGALYGLHKKWWVPGWVHNKVVAESEFWRDKYLAMFDVTATVVSAVEKSIPEGGRNG